LVLLADFEEEAFKGGRSAEFTAVETPFVAAEEDAEVSVRLVLLG